MKKLFINFSLDPKKDILSGVTVALALVPEAVAFAFVAGIDPLVGLYGAFIMGLVTSTFTYKSSKNNLTIGLGPIL